MGACLMPIRHTGCIIHTDSLRSSLKGFFFFILLFPPHIQASRQVRFDGFGVPGKALINPQSGNAAQWTLTLQVPDAGLAPKQCGEPWFSFFKLISCCTETEISTVFKPTSCVQPHITCNWFATAMRATKWPQGKSLQAWVIDSEEWLLLRPIRSLKPCTDITCKTNLVHFY